MKDSLLYWFQIANGSKQEWDKAIEAEGAPKISATIPFPDAPALARDELWYLIRSKNMKSEQSLVKDTWNLKRISSKEFR